MGEGDLAPDKRAAAVQDGWVCFEDEAGRILRPPKARTWSRRGRTPVTEVSGKGSGRISIAGLVCFQPGRRGSPARLLYRTREHRGRKGERRSFCERDYIALLDATHQRLGGPIVLVWDNLNTHLSRRVRRYLAARRDWLTVYRLPPYAPDLNAVESAWAHLTTGLGNHLFHGLDSLKTAITHRLRHLQHKPELLAGFLHHTGLPLEPG